MKIPRKLLFAAVLALSSALALPSKTTATTPTFKLVDAGVNGPELNVGVSPNGSVFVGGWDAVGRSTDGGNTWTSVQPGPVGVAADRVLIVDHVTGRVIEEDTALAGCALVQWSDDNGTSWTSNSACSASVTDHAKVAVGKRTTLVDPTGKLYQNIMYMCANGLSNTGCAESPNGGLTWLPTAPHGVGCAFQGTPKADASGTLYEPTSACGLQIRKTADNGLTWTEITTPFATGPDTPDLAITPDGTVYLMWIDANWQPEFARSSNGGVSWSGPFAVPVTGLRSSVFPAIVAGANGKIAMQFYGTTDDATGWDHIPGNAPDSIRWNGYMAVVIDAGAATPTVAPIQVTSSTQPLQYGCLSKLGSCLDNIADYDGIDASADGHVFGVFIDGCLPGCTNHATSTSDRAMVAVQTGGDLIR
jgi:hypothetical protein